MECYLVVSQLSLSNYYHTGLGLILHTAISARPRLRSESAPFFQLFDIPS